MIEDHPDVAVRVDAFGRQLLGPADEQRAYDLVSFFPEVLDGCFDDRRIVLTVDDSEIADGSSLEPGKG